MDIFEEFKRLTQIKNDTNLIKKFEHGNNYPNKCREAAIHYGTHNLEFRQLLGLILGCSKEIAENLSEMGAKKMFNYTPKEIMEHANTSEVMALQIKSMFSVYERLRTEIIAGKLKIDSTIAAGDYLISKMRYLEQEQIVVLLLNTRSEIIKEVTVTTGLVNQSLAHPREIFKEAIRENASSIIMAHNHPTGNIKASAEDLKITKRIKEAGEIIDIKLIDHIIVGGNKYYSFVEEGHL